MITATVAIVSGTTSRSFGRARRSIVPDGRWNSRSAMRGVSRPNSRANSFSSFGPMPGKTDSEANSGSSKGGRMVQASSIGERAGADEHRARAHDALSIDHQVGIGEDEAASDLLHVDMGLDPVPDLRRARKV